ncbi:MAG: hypothetical protein IJX76_07040, partial [Clostridia bacterium]|nr:hypothetical protein [Clostridia bacterium]
QLRYAQLRRGGKKLRRLTWFFPPLERTKAYFTVFVNCDAILREGLGVILFLSILKFIYHITTNP